MFMLDPIPALQTSLFHTAKVFKTLYRQAFPYKPKILQRICRFLKKLVLLCNLSQRYHEIKNIFLDFEKVFTVRESTDSFPYVLKKCIHWFPEIFGTPNRDAGRDFIVELSSDYNVALGWPFSLFSNVGERSFASSAYFTLRLCHHFFDKIKLANEERSAVSYERSVFLVDPLFREPKPRCVLNSIFVSMGNEYLEEGFTLQSVEPETNKSDHADERYKKEMKPWTVSNYSSNRNKSTRMVYERLKPSKSSNVSMPSTKSVRLKTWIFALAFLLSQAYAKPINKSNDTDKSIVDNFTALVTPRCNPENLDMTQHCQLNDFYLGLFIENCEFKNLCSPGYEPKCVDVQDGMVHICIPIGLTCEKGYRWHPWVDKTDQGVKVRVEKCPHDTFQQYKSNCFHACTTKHLDINDMPEHYLVYSEGNNIFPTYVYCNYEMGYYNRDYKFLMDYDQDSMHDPYFCQNVETFNPCIDNEIPLPNGSCVVPCMQGECRDDHDGFICKQHCREQTIDGETDGKLATRNEDEDECQGESGTCKNGVCPKSYKNNVCQCFPGYRNDIETRHCIDMDECQDIKGLCINGNCTNTAGSYDCICDSGFKLEIGTRQCTEMNVPEDQSTKWIIIGSIIVTVLAVCVIILCIICNKSRVHEVQEPHSGDGDARGKSEYKNDANSFDDDVSKEDDQNESKDSFGDDGCQKPLLRKPGVNAAPETDCSNVKSHQQIVEITDTHCIDKCIDQEERNGKCSKASHIENMHVTNNFYFTEDQLIHALRSRRDSPYQNEDSSRIQVQPQGERYDKGEPYKKSFDNTFSQYSMEHHTKLMQSVGALVVKQRPVGTPMRAGTVFRIGDLLLMTARHVIKSIVDPEDTGNANWSLLESDNVYVNFNASLINEARIQYRVKCICISVDPDLDFAILQVTNPTQLPLKMLLYKCDYERLNAKQLSIIGFGHTTEHNDKCIDPFCQILSPDGDRVLKAKEYITLHREDFLTSLRNQTVGDYSMVDRSYLGIERRHNIIVDCFMEHGASGAPAVSPCGNVVGILTHGLPELFFNLPEHKQKVFPPEHRVEIVLKMQYIYNYLKEHHLDLADDIFN